MKKSKRITVKSHNIQFLESLAVQMGITDLSEVINYLLLDCKGLGYIFGSKNQPQPAPQPAPQPEQTSIGYAFDRDTFEPAFQPVQEQNHTNNQADETILRLASLIENF